VVRDIAGTALSDVSVTLVGESVATRTDSVGVFVLADVALGMHTVLFRRIGYRSVEYRWPTRLGVALQVEVTMTPVPRALDRVVVEAPGASRRRGTSSIGGTVTDSSGQSMPGADVRLLGAGMSTITDSMGRFEFRLLAKGSYIVRVRHHGFQPMNAFMQILDDDHRGISIKIYDLSDRMRGRSAEAASGYGVADVGFEAFDRRYRSSAGSIVLGPADLVRADRMPLDLLVQQYRGLPARRIRPSIGRDDRVSGPRTRIVC
jgi:hypothetical protein